MNAELDSKAETKKLSRKEKDDRILWKKNNFIYKTPNNYEAKTYKMPGFFWTNRILPVI